MIFSAKKGNSNGLEVLSRSLELEGGLGTPGLPRSSTVKIRHRGSSEVFLQIPG